MTTARQERIQYKSIFLLFCGYRECSWVESFETSQWAKIRENQEEKSLRQAIDVGGESSLFSLYHESLWSGLCKQHKRKNCAMVCHFDPQTMSRKLFQKGSKNDELKSMKRIDDMKNFYLKKSFFARLLLDEWAFDGFFAAPAFALQQPNVDCCRGKRANDDNKRRAGSNICFTPLTEVVKSSSSILLIHPNKIIVICIEIYFYFLGSPPPRPNLGSFFGSLIASFK